MSSRREWRTIAFVGAGGAIGAIARWALGAAMTSEPATWPWATLVVNLLGCAAIGVAARRIPAGTDRWAFAVTGLLGGFTTFSAFAVELNEMVDAGRGILAVSYGGVTLLGGVIAVAVARHGSDAP